MNNVAVDSPVGLAVGLAVELTRAAAAVAALGGSSAEFAGLSDAQVLTARGPIADLLRLSNTVAALLAGTI
ncbi:hypothetical protein, partial [Cryobacterium sp. PH29-G1]|uniref:hypothetical protein n=1 Tax=Cryobacterium sp. PH29-G1 TaxID=3046211 RepID=UPI0024BA1EA6